MKCWDCGQELDTSEIEKEAATKERIRLARVVAEGALVLRDKGDRAWRALDALGEELKATRGL